MIIVIIYFLVVRAYSQKALPECGVQDAFIYLTGSENGPHVTKVIVMLDEAVMQAVPGEPYLELAGVPHEIRAIYMCDQEGTPLQQVS